MLGFSGGFGRIEIVKKCAISRDICDFVIFFGEFASGLIAVFYADNWSDLAEIRKDFGVFSFWENDEIWLCIGKSFRIIFKPHKKPIVF